MTYRVCILWPSDASAPVIEGQNTHRQADGALEVEYTPDQLRAVVAMMKSIRGQQWSAADAAAWVRVIPLPTTEGTQESLL